jgi:hypothetical protein
MSNNENTSSPFRSASEQQAALEEKLEYACIRLEKAQPFNKVRFQHPVLDLSRRRLDMENGIQILYTMAPRLDKAGLFTGTDWSTPQTLLPALVTQTLEHGERDTVMMECLSELRLLAIAGGIYYSPGISAEHASHFLTQVLALNLEYLFGTRTEATRERLGPLGVKIEELFQFILTHIGFGNILENLIEEIWRIMAQRPIQVQNIKTMVTRISVMISREDFEIDKYHLGADRLTSALFSPTQGCNNDPGIEAYQNSLATMDFTALQLEACGFARSMHDTGLVSDYHAVFLRFLITNKQFQLIPDGLGLSSTGLDILRCYQDLVHALINEAIYPHTAQAIYGLAMLLERGILHIPALAPALWQQIGQNLSDHTESILTNIFGQTAAPKTKLLAGVISLLGQPLGIAQGNNPTCQSARALSLWSYNSPDYLLFLIHQMTKYDSILMHFEGLPVISSDLPAGLVQSSPLDADPVSALLVPHLDRIYNEMSRLCAGRGEDPHCWINPEFHGWWTGRDFVIVVDIKTGNLKNIDTFITRFYNSYHPFYNNNQPVIHPQPVGIAVTDSNANFVGWHAITLIRVALDQKNVMRVYFYNPNNDSGQNWGNGTVVSTHGQGERFGEASLPFPEFASRLYIFHDDPLDNSDPEQIPEAEMLNVREMMQQSWASNRM